MNSKIKALYEKESVVDYYDKLTESVGVINSERIIFKKYIKNNSKILDVGCGTGRTTIYLFEKGFKDIIGIDLSTKMIKIAKEKYPKINFESIDVLDYKTDDAFDVIIFSFNGLMLIKTYDLRLKITEKICKLIKHDGIFIFSTPFLDNKYQKKSWTTILKNKKDDPNWEYGDIYFNDYGAKDIFLHIPFKKEIQTMIEKAGFKEIKYKQRLEIAVENDEIEEHLDDNLYWIARK